MTTVWFKGFPWTLEHFLFNGTEGRRGLCRGMGEETVPREENDCCPEEGEEAVIFQNSGRNVSRFQSLI